MCVSQMCSTLQQEILLERKAVFRFSVLWNLPLQDSQNELLFSRLSIYFSYVLLLNNSYVQFGLKMAPLKWITVTVTNVKSWFQISLCQMLISWYYHKAFFQASEKQRTDISRLMCWNSYKKDKNQAIKQWAPGRAKGGLQLYLKHSLILYYY